MSNVIYTPTEGLTQKEKLQIDIEFGESLIESFLLENRLITPVVTPTESLELLTQFNNIEKLARLGDIKSVKILLSGINVDNRLFTQDRKDNYMELINKHLGL